MGKLRLVIADADEAYIESLADCLSGSYSDRFEVSYFTDSSCLEEFLKKSGKLVDILLTSPEMLNGEVLNGAGASGLAGTLSLAGTSGLVRTTVLFSDGRQNGTGSRHNGTGFHTINKYQHIGRLVGDVIGIITENAADKEVRAYGSRKTRAVAVYSPSGGTGKTTIAAYAAILCSRRGKTAFYLNLENIQSTPAFFESSPETSLSRVLFYIKEKSPNLVFKIEAAAGIDPGTGVRYFSPLQGVEELEEMHPGEIRQFIYGLKAAGFCDVIFIDMSDSLDSRSRAVLEACDEILLVALCDGRCRLKLKTTAGAFDRFSRDEIPDIWKKVTLVVNKFKNQPFMRSCLEDAVKKPVTAWLPEIPALDNWELDSCEDILPAIDGSIEFAGEMTKLTERLFSGDEAYED